MPHKIVEVEKGFAGDRAGFRPGDELSTIDGQTPADVIDYELFVCKRSFAAEVLRNGGKITLHVKKGEYEPMGLRFDEDLMSRQRDCVNKCVFCFVDQLPENVRPTMRVKDDDWRMSLMMGSFVTLTNVSDRELDRIIDRRCHPLYISVHATDPDVREKLLGQKLGRKIMSQLKRLSDAGLTFHTQAVVCPGLNDGAVLDRTMDELARMYPRALTLAVVPVGLTGHREGLCPLRPFSSDEAKRLLDQVDRFNDGFQREHGEKFVFPADELYLLAGRDFPPDETYGDYDQIENGVGLCRRLETDFGDAWREADFGCGEKRKLAIACGTSVAPFLRNMLERFPVPGSNVEIHPIVNRFFGPTVTVSGLLTGGDIVRAMHDVDCDAVLITRTMLREYGDVFLDDMSLSDVEKTLGKPIEPISDAWALLDAINRDKEVR